MVVLLAILAVILFLGMIADKDKDNRKNFTYAFMTVVIALVVFCKFQKDGAVSRLCHRCRTKCEKVEIVVVLLHVMVYTNGRSRSDHNTVVQEGHENMTRTELTIALNKMFCNYIQESDDMATFFEIAINYVEENSELDLDDDTQYEEALQIIDDAIVGKY